MIPGEWIKRLIMYYDVVRYQKDSTTKPEMDLLVVEVDYYV